MLKHRELQTLDEDEIREKIKRRKKLRETREEQEQLVKMMLVMDDGCCWKMIMTMDDIKYDVE